MIVLASKSWLRLLFPWRGAPVLPIWRRLGLVMVVAGAVTYVHSHNILPLLDLTSIPFSLVGVALGIFLGFRNNTAYDRFWEGRKLWGSLVNTSRSLTRQILSLVPGTPGLHRDLVYQMLAFTHALRHHLRDEALPGDAAAFLPADEAAAMAADKNPPAYVLHRLGERFAELSRTEQLSPFHLYLLENSLVSLTDILGACERIKNTPIPYSYTVLIHQLVAGYVFTLPFGLVHSIGGYTPLVVLMVGYAFLGLDAIGDEIEEPFGTDPSDLPLSALCRTIEINGRQRLGETDLPPALEPVDHILH